MSIIEEIMLIKVSSAENNNKFYEVKLHDDSTVAKRWGRVGADGQRASENTGRNGFDKIVRAKKRGGYTEVDVRAVPSASPDKSTLKSVASTFLGGKDSPAVAALIERLVDVNKHEIIAASGGLIRVAADGALTTPLGVISATTIARAQSVLDQIKASDKAPVRLVEEYMTLVPQKIKRDRGWEETIFDSPEKIQKQADFLVQLRDSNSWSKAKSEAEEVDESQYADLFRYTISEVTDAATIDRITTFYNGTKNRSHMSSALKIKRVFALTDTKSEQAYADVLAAVGNERQLWHGTRAFNLLSILRRGLYVPPQYGAPMPIAGRMFGDGVYLSDQSTKSLNYSHGYWSGAREDNCYMLLADVAMGNEFRPNMLGINRVGRTELTRAHSGVDDKGKPFHSISVRGGTCGVANNEMIVWNASAISLKYIVEFSA